jgi:uncharacterized protein (TIGR03790 family)
MSLPCSATPLRFLLAGSLLSGLSSAPLKAQIQSHPEVLVVYNTNFADSLTVANYYMTKRAIPSGNLCAISPPSSVGISMTDYINTVKTPVQNCLTTAGRSSVLYVVFSYLTPYYIVAPSPSTVTYSLDSYVSDIWDQYTKHDYYPPPAPHRYYAASQSQGNVFAPFVSLSAFRSQPRATLMYSVWRLDAASLALAEGLVDKAMQAEANGGPVGQGCFDELIDATIAPDGGPRSGDWSIHVASQFMAQAGFGVTEDVNEAEFGTAPAPLTCPNTAFFSGWYSLNHYNDVFTWNTGAIGFHLDSESAIDPRGGANWVANAVIRGITTTSGSVNEPFLEGLPRPAGVFRNLLEGANVGDAFLRNTQWIKWMVMNVGDPLYTPFPGGHAPFKPGYTVNSLALSSQQVVGAAPVTGSPTGTIKLSTPAPAGGVTFNLSPTPAGLATVPATVTVPAGSTKATFSINTSAINYAYAYATITASGPVTLNNTLAIYPLLAGISTNQSTVTGGQMLTGAIFLNDGAPYGNAVISLTSSNTSVATVPATVTMITGSSSATFSISTNAVNASTPVTLSATYGGYTVTTQITVVP